MYRRKIINSPLLPQILSVTLALILILSTSLIGVSIGIRTHIKESCFENLDDTLEQAVKSLNIFLDKDRKHLTSLASVIACQEDVHSPAVLSVLQSFDKEDTMPNIGILYPDDRVLRSDGVYESTVGVLSFETESELGAHLSGKSTLISFPERVVLRHFVPVVQNGETVAMLYGVIDLSKIIEIFQMDMYDGSAELYFADTDTGDVIMDTYHDSLGTIDMLRQRPTAAGYNIDEIIADILAGNSGRFISLSKSTKTYFYASYQPAGINNWEAMLTVSEPIVMQQAEFPTNLLIFLAVVYAASFIIYGLTVFKIYRRHMGMFANTPAGICIVNTDNKLSILQANKEFYRIMCLDDKKPKDVANNLPDMLSDEDKSTVFKTFKKLLSHSGSTERLELQVTDREGMPKHVLVTAYYDNRDSFITMNFLDITERKRMEQRLLLLDQEYRIAMQMTKRYVVFYDIAQKTANLLPGAANVFNLTEKSENFPQSLLDDDLLDEESKPAFDEFFKAVRDESESGSAYLRLRRTVDSDFRWYRAEFFTVYGDDRKKSFVILSFEDAEERHKNELAYSRLQQTSSEIPESLYKSYECNLTKNKIESEGGQAVVSLGEALCDDPDELRPFIEKHVCEEYCEPLADFVDRKRLIKAFRGGQTLDRTEIRLISDNGGIWFSVDVQLIEDSFSGDIKAYYLFRNIDERKKQEIKAQLDMDRLKTELENSRIRIMMNQMQPHFLYNALSAIRTFTKLDPDYAYKMIGDFTVHLRSSIKSLQSDAPIPFSEEMKNIKAYLNIEKMRMGDRLDFEYDIQCTDFDVVPMSIQPLAENAARHGIYPLGERGGVISVKSRETDSAYVIVVSDNGAGFDVDEVLTRKSDSIGLKNLIFRLKKLMNADVDINSTIGKGTTVTVTLPKGDEQHENDFGG